MHVILDKPFEFMEVFRLMATIAAPLLKYDQELGLPVRIRATATGLRIHTRGSGFDFAVSFKGAKVVEDGEIVIHHGLFHKIPLTDAISLKTTKNALKFVSGSASGTLLITHASVDTSTIGKSGVNLYPVSALDLRLLLNGVLFRQVSREPTSIKLIADKNKLFAYTNDAFKAASTHVPMKSKTAWSVTMPRMFAESLARGLSGTEGMLKIGSDPMRVVLQSRTFNLTFPTLQAAMPVVNVKKFIKNNLDKKNDNRVKAIFPHELMLQGVKDTMAVFRNSSEDKILGLEFYPNKRVKTANKVFQGCVRLLAHTAIGTMTVVVPARVDRELAEMSRLYVDINHLHEFMSMASDKSSNALAKKGGEKDKFGNLTDAPQLSTLYGEEAFLVLKTDRFLGLFRTKQRRA